MNVIAAKQFNIVQRQYEISAAERALRVEIGRAHV